MGRYEDMGVSKNRGNPPKMDGENNGQPYEQMHDLGVALFLETPILIWQQNIKQSKGWFQNSEIMTKKDVPCSLLILILCFQDSPLKC